MRQFYVLAEKPYKPDHRFFPALTFFKLLDNVKKFTFFYYKSINGAHTSAITSLVSLQSSPTSSMLLASSSKDGKIKIWNLTTLTLLQTIEDHFGSVEILAYSRYNRYGGPLLASGSYDTTIKLWQITNDSSLLLVQTLQDDDDNGHSDTVVSLVFLDEDRLLASASLDTSVIVWDLVDNYRLKYKFTKHVAYVNVLVAIDEMGLLASGSGDTTINVWDIFNDGKLKYTFTQHTDQIEVLAYVGDGLLVSGSFDRTIKIWDLINGGILKYSIDATSNDGGHTNWVTVLTRLETNKSFASGSMDNTIKLWTIE